MNRAPTTDIDDEPERLIASVSATNGCDQNGNEPAKTVSGTTTTDAWDPQGLGQILSDGAGSEYVWGLGLVSQVATSGTTYAQADGLGSVRLLTDSSGNQAGTQTYDAYGASRSQSGTQLPFGFAGQQTDPESGLQYLRAREYDPSTGRFPRRNLGWPRASRMAQWPLDPAPSILSRTSKC